MAQNLSEDDRRALQHLEESLWIEGTRFDRCYMDRVVAADFTEVGRSGRIHTREAVLDCPRGPIDAAIPLPNFQARLLTPDVALVTYDSAVTYDGVVERGRRSSMWSRQGDGWVLRFHQGTPYE